MMKKQLMLVLGILFATSVMAQKKSSIPPPPPPVPSVENVNPPLSIPDDYRSFLKRNPSVKSVGWFANGIRMHLKSGKEEKYNLDSGNELAVLKQKYGAPPVAPPPPPVER